MDFHSQANLVRLVAGQPFVASFFSSINEAVYIYSQVRCKNLTVKIITKVGITGTFYFKHSTYIHLICEVNGISTVVISILQMRKSKHGN